MLKKISKLGAQALKLHTATSAFKFRTSAVLQSELKQFSDSFLTVANAQYIDQLYFQWVKDHTSVPKSWDAYFRNEHSGLDISQAFLYPELSEQLNVGSGSDIQVKRQVSDNVRARLLIDAYRVRGHEKADLDPLEMDKANTQYGKKRAEEPAKLHYSDFGFSEQDLDRELYITDKVSKGITSQNPRITLREIYDKLNNIYSGKVGYQYMHITDPEQRYWIRDRIENHEEFKPTKKDLENTGRRLARDYYFNEFMKQIFSTSKRFGVEGVDSVVSGMEALIDEAAITKIENVVIGMAHRGRLSTLFNVIKKPASQIFAEFLEIGKEYKEGEETAGDVKYHLGVTHDKVFDWLNNHKVTLSLLPNPSHLETVNPLVYGQVRAIQDYLQDKDSQRSFGILIHGDAAFSGQGIVYESLQFQDLKAYQSGGLIHVVMNNQIGFTTVPSQNRASLYCTDLAESVQAPIFHVNADAPEMVDQVFKLAFHYRQKFKKDVVIDVIGYRRYGHNELDQPMFTQPLMYQIIDKRPKVYELYRKYLIEQGVWTEDSEAELGKKYKDFLQGEYEKSRNATYDKKYLRLNFFEELKKPSPSTGVSRAILTEISEKLHTLPGQDQLVPNAQVKKVYDARLQSIKDNSGFEFATAEALAWGTLLKEGFGVRITGQDVERGTFSHRHSKIVDQQFDREKFVPLQNLLSKQDLSQQKLLIANSHLSEYGVLGFEYGYSLINHNFFVAWEAQFGDFANGAQIMIDNYIASGESKWGVQSGITIMLPHGMDGQGSEHSSGRIERFLQLSNDDEGIFSKPEKLAKQDQLINLQVIVPSTSGNYFHAIRRQLHRDFRKPLITFNSKRLLRFKNAFSTLEDIDTNTSFQVVIPDKDPSVVPAAQAEKVILCFGQFYYDLQESRNKQGLKNTHLVRIEQLAPFPYVKLHDLLAQYPNAEFNFAQEEHMNQGAYEYIQPRVNAVLKKLHEAKKIKSPKLAGTFARVASSSSATGSGKQHKKELETLLAKAFSPKKV